MSEAAFVPLSERRTRRDALAQAIGDGMALVPAARVAHRNADNTYPFRQDSDFAWLTGFDEPDALLALAPGNADGEQILFCQRRDPAQERWTGPRAGPEGAIAHFGMDSAFALDDLDERMLDLLGRHERLHFALGRHSGWDQRVLGWLQTLQARQRAGGKPPTSIHSLDVILHEMRLFKSLAEQACMREAAQIAVRAHRRAMRLCRPGLSERDLETELLHAFRQHGAHELSYAPIVAAGANACVLHYTRNDATIQDGDLVLIDAGCELQGYASDITRTFPANGRFSGEQRALHEVVLAAQHAALDAVAPGNSWMAPHERATQVLTAGLVTHGLLVGDVDELVAREAYRPFYMHRTGHWLGMDVHDRGDYQRGGQWRPLEPGMTLTVEPGLYIAPDQADVAARWRGIGIRIEDDVLVTDSGHETLSAGLEQSADEVEALMRS